MQKEAETAVEAVKSGDSVHSIFRSAAGFFSGTAVSRVSGLFRDVALAYAFGTSAALAAFFVAFRFSHVLRRLFGEGALQTAFIPLFEEIRKSSPDKAFRFFRDLNALWILLLSAVILLGMGGLFLYLQHLPTSAPSYDILFLTALMLPSLLPICLFGLNASLLQCEKRFFTVGFAPTAFNCIFACGACLLRSNNPTEAMPYLAGTIVFACAFQWFFTLIPAIRLCGGYFKNGFLEELQIFSFEIKKLWGPLSLGILGVGASQINNAIDALFARFADPEGPAQLWFSVRFQQLPLALFGIALSGALLPPLSRALQKGETQQFLSFLEFAIRKTSAFLVPCTVYFLVLGMNIIHCVYSRGDFQTQSVITTTECLQGYAFALVPMGLVLIFAPAFYAKKNYSIPARGAIIALLANTLFDALLVFCFDLKALSIAIATSIASLMNAWYLFSQLQKEWGPILSKEGYINIIKLILSSLGAGLITFLVLGMIQGYPTLLGLFSQNMAHLPECLYERISTLLAASLVFVVSLFLIAKLLKAKDLLSILHLKRQ